MQTEVTLKYRARDTRQTPFDGHHTKSLRPRARDTAVLLPKEMTDLGMVRLAGGGFISTLHLTTSAHQTAIISPSPVPAQWATLPAFSWAAMI